MFGIAAPCPRCGEAFKTCTPGVPCPSCEFAERKRRHDEGKCEQPCYECAVERVQKGHSNDA